MRHLLVKRRRLFPILFIYFLLNSYLAFSQTNSNGKKEGNLGMEPFVMNLGTTIQEEMKHSTLTQFTELKSLIQQIQSTIPTTKVELKEY